MTNILALQRLKTPSSTSLIKVVSCTSSGSNCCNGKRV
jgi:hypothetical protein